MKTIELYLNIVHYCFYKAHYKSYLFSNKINPFILIHKLPFQKRRYEKLGIDIRKELDNVVGDKNSGISVIYAGGILLVLLCFFFGLIGIFIKFILEDTLSTIYFVLFGVLSALVCYIFVFKNDKYIKNFKKFEKWTKEEKKEYSWQTFVIIIVVAFLWILSF